MSVTGKFEGKLKKTAVLSCPAQVSETGWGGPAAWGPACPVLSCSDLLVLHTPARPWPAKSVWNPDIACTQSAGRTAGQLRSVFSLLRSHSDHLGPPLSHTNLSCISLGISKYPHSHPSQYPGVCRPPLLPTYDLMCEISRNVF